MLSVSFFALHCDFVLAEESRMEVFELALLAWVSLSAILLAPVVIIINNRGIR